MAKIFHSDRRAARKARKDTSQVPGAGTPLPTEEIPSGIPHSVPGPTDDGQIDASAMGTEAPPEAPAPVSAPIDPRVELVALLRKSPASAIPGQSPKESFHQFRERALTQVRGAMQKLASAPDSKIVLPVAPQIIRLIRAWAAQGLSDDLSVSNEVMAQPLTANPGEVERFSPDANGDWQLAPLSGALEGGSIYLVSHIKDPVEHEHFSARQSERAQIVQHVQNGDFGRARSIAQKAEAAGLPDHEIGDAIDEGLPDDQSAQGLDNDKLLAMASAASPKRRAGILPIVQSRFGDLGGLDPMSAQTLKSHLGRLHS